MSQTVCIAFAGGCSRAMVDTALLYDYFDANGWVRVDDLESADLVVVTSCGVDQSMEDASIQLLHSTNRRRKSGSTLAITGCLAGIWEARLRDEFDAVVIPPHDYSRLDTLISAERSIFDMPDPHVIEPRVEQSITRYSNLERLAMDNAFTERLRKAVSGSPLGSAIRRLTRREVAGGLVVPYERYTLRVAWGCRGTCSYCAIRAACGPLRSKPLDAVLSEFDAGLAAGATEFRLVAQDLGAYGQDIGTDIYELLRGIFDREGDFHLDLVDFNIRWILSREQELIQLLADNRARIREMNLPLQSGSDRILGLMRRGHTAAEAERIMKALRAALPGVRLATHALAGFPGETEQDFDETMRVLHAVGFDGVDVFAYTDRPGTDARQMPDKVPASVIRQRSARLHREFHGRNPGVTGLVPLIRKAALARRSRRWSMPEGAPVNVSPATAAATTMETESEPENGAAVG